MNVRRWSARHARLMASILLIAVAGAGMAAGVLIDRLLLAPGVAEASQGAFGVGIPFARDADRKDTRILRHGGPEAFARELGFTPEQRVRVDSLLERQTQALRAVREVVRPRMDSLMNTFRVQLDSLLTPDQRQRLEAMRDRGPRMVPSPGAPPPRFRRRGDSTAPPPGRPAPSGSNASA